MTEIISAQWFIHRQLSGICTISDNSEILEIVDLSAVPETNLSPTITEAWGPYASQNEAIAKRVGLIRAGKCRPA